MHVQYQQLSAYTLFVVLYMECYLHVHVQVEESEKIYIGNVNNYKFSLCFDYLCFPLSLSFFSYI